MIRKVSAAILAAVALLLILSWPRAGRAEDLIVEPSPSSGSGHYATIQDALAFAKAELNADPNRRFQVLVRPGTYTGPITAISNVPIIGSSTSGTFITGSGTVVSLNGVSDVTIRNFTFQFGTVAISVSNNSSAIIISNNVFALNRSATAVQVIASPDTLIRNNTFYNNNIAIGTDSAITVTSNIFDHNNTAISTGPPLSTLSFNGFYNNQSKGVIPDNTNLPNGTHGETDPRFIDPPNDFRLQDDSPAKGTGNPNYPNSFDSSFDMGAYGGPGSDIITTNPSAVTGLNSSIDSPLTAPAVMTLRWNRSSNSAVTAYRVYYGTASRIYQGTGADEGASGFSVGTNSATLTFKELPATPAAPATAPTLAPPVAGNQTLHLSWTKVANATGYRIYYSTSAFDSPNLPATPSPIEVDGGGTTSYTLTGLNNGTTYFIRVSAVAGNKIFAAVTAVVDRSVDSAPGSANESPFSQETSQSIGPTLEGPLSDQQSDFPEGASPFPNLKGGGCFIATAAYGFYSAPQVQALRIFRDRYLMTNSPGRAFVAWYYRVGPRGADLLRAHPWLKLPVRIVLFPLVAIAWFLAYTSPLLKAIVLLAGVSSWALYRLRFRFAVGRCNGGRW